VKEKTSLQRAKIQAADLQRINQAADRLNSDAAEVLEYQALDESPPESAM
jgi:hypothetical protein